MTERKKTERSPNDARSEATKASQARRAWMAHMRHELHTPLNAVIGYTEMLLEDAESRGEARILPDLRRMHSAGQQLLALVDDVLSPSRIPAGSTALDPESFRAAVRHELRTPLNAIIGYSELLLEDSAESGPPDFVLELERIRTAGLSLLALMSELAQFSEGEERAPEAHAEDPGVSTVIRDVVTSVPPLADGVAPGPASGRLLVVDDNEVNRDLLSRRLGKEGYTVTLAENGRQALEILQEQSFDLVLLDMMMPEMNGYGLLQHLKADPGLRHLPVIIISAFDEVDSVVRCIELGAEDYLPKPFNPVLLKARIGACLEKKRLRDREVLYLRQIQEEKQRADELLHVILPPEIVDELKSTNTVTPRLYPNVAVLFCDVVEFTPYCERSDPEEVISRLQRLIEIYEELVLQYAMQKIKTIGDAFMATAGLLRPVENPVLNCARCGLEMVSAAQHAAVGWKVRVGVHVGPVMAGVVGRRQYLFDLWGDTVNTAARVQTHGAIGAVNVSGAAWTQIAGRCQGESLGLIPVKGKGRMEIFRVFSSEQEL